MATGECPDCGFQPGDELVITDLRVQLADLRAALALSEQRREAAERERDEARGKAAYMVEAFWLAMADLDHPAWCACADDGKECDCWRSAAAKVDSTDEAVALCTRVRDLEDELGDLRDELKDREGRCSVHSDQKHGAEAEELRKGVEKLIADMDDLGRVEAEDLQTLLDRVDARDSLACVETIDRLRAALAAEQRENSRLCSEFSANLASVETERDEARAEVELNDHRFAELWDRYSAEKRRADEATGDVERLRFERDHYAEILRATPIVIDDNPLAWGAAMEVVRLRAARWKALARRVRHQRDAARELRRLEREAAASIIRFITGDRDAAESRVRELEAAMRDIASLANAEVFSSRLNEIYRIARAALAGKGE